MTIRVLAEKGENLGEISRTLGVTDGVVRYHLDWAEEGAEDTVLRTPRFGSFGTTLEGPCMTSDQKVGSRTTHAPRDCPLQPPRK